MNPDILLKSGSPIQQRSTATCPSDCLTSATPNMRPTLDFNQPNRSTPVATDQKVGDPIPPSAPLFSQVIALTSHHPQRPFPSSGRTLAGSASSVAEVPYL